jgi:crotonobetainyl-CoA:carnitine CoA-transferase CaiB-like acyl-CoA transferase
MSGPLAGIRVLELARILAGPWVGQLLADFGAEVIKIERPGTGDDTRGWGPPWLRDDEGCETGESAYFLAANRGKRSVAIDLANPRGQQLVRDLAGCSDVLIENFRVGGLARYGLDWATLKKRYPGLVYCSITGFGQDGPRAHQVGYDAAIQAMGGLMSITGEPDGGPQKVGVAVADLMAGMYAANAIQAALIHRDKSGKGQSIDLSLLDTQVAWLANQAANYLIGGQVPGRQGTAHPNIVPYQVFACADGHLMLAVGNDSQFERFARLAGHPEWAADERFRQNCNRVAHRQVLIGAIKPVMAGRTVSEWLELLATEGIPAAPINDLDAVFDDPQVRHRQMVQPIGHPWRAALPLVANPVRFSATPVEYRYAPPLLGADTRAVLSDCLGLDDEGIAALERDGVVEARSG